MLYESNLLNESSNMRYFFNFISNRSVLTLKNELYTFMFFLPFNGDIQLVKLNMQNGKLIICIVIYVAFSKYFPALNGY